MIKAGAKIRKQKIFNGKTYQPATEKPLISCQWKQRRITPISTTGAGVKKTANRNIMKLIKYLPHPSSSL